MITKLLKLLLLPAVILFVICWLLGPSRIYSMLNSRQIEATVKDIKSFSAAKDAPEAFSIEFETTGGEIFVVTSFEKTWAVVSKGDVVRAKIHPASPWSDDDGAWINARLINKLSNNK